jgi:hypothetical protein
MDDYRSADDIMDMKFIGEKAHFAISVVLEQDGKIARMIAVGLIRRIPMSVRGYKRIGWIAYLTHSVLMYVKTVGSDWRLAVLSRTVGGQSAHFDADFRTCRKVPEGRHSMKVRRQGTSHDFRNGNSAFVYILKLIIFSV